MYSLYGFGGFGRRRGWGKAKKSQKKKKEHWFGKFTSHAPFSSIWFYGGTNHIISHLIMSILYRAINRRSKQTTMQGYQSSSCGQQKGSYGKNFT